jgi:hypothetical protein
MEQPENQKKRTPSQGAKYLLLVIVYAFLLMYGVPSTLGFVLNLIGGDYANALYQVPGPLALLLAGYVLQKNQTNRPRQ